MIKSFASVVAALTGHKNSLELHSMSNLFVEDPSRCERFSVSLEDLLFDFSKQRIDSRALRDLLSLAATVQLDERRRAFFAGKIVNPTEGRAALHMALRDPTGRAYFVEGKNVSPEVTAELVKIDAFASAVRDGRIRGASAPFSDIVNIGIGGSDLGPAMATRALGPFVKKEFRAHFVSNVDGADLGDVIAGLDPSRTLFIISSKTFTTLETMTNAQSARQWIASALGERAVADHFAAVSTQLDLVRDFGIRSDRVFGFWDWVGGRYSIWSAIGLALAIAIGPENFNAFLRGGHAMDRHFETAAFDRNIPTLMGLIAFWNRNVWGCASQAIIPYDHRLSRFPAYLQQLEMESNGKSVTLEGQRSRQATCPVVWGEPGTNGQHAFFQLLHQGTDIVPVDFIIAAEPTDADPHHHEFLYSNCLAQSEALMNGRSEDEAKARMRSMGIAETDVERLAPHRSFRGNRPSSTIIYRRLDPFSLGRLIALYEHAVFVQGVLWDIDSFDQWGVELGKELAGKLAPAIANQDQSLSGLFPATAHLVDWRRRLISQ